jgi:hypothetical protein
VNLLTEVTNRLNFLLNNSLTGQALLARTNAVGGNVTVKLKQAGVTATLVKTVTVSLNETLDKANQPSTDAGLKELVESAIFEMNNATRSDQFAQLDQNFPNALTLTAFGQGRANIEAESTWVVYEILTQMQGVPHNYVPSAWGQGQVNDVQQSGAVNLIAYQPLFRVKRHDTAAAPGSSKWLHSEEMYAYQKILDTKDNDLFALLDAVARVTKLAGGKRISTKKLRDDGLSMQNQQKTTEREKGRAVLYSAAIKLFGEMGIHPHTNTWQVNLLRGALAGNWAFTAEMDQVANTTNVDFIKDRFLDAVRAPTKILV